MRTKIETRESNQKHKKSSAQGNREAPYRTELTANKEGKEAVENEVDRAVTTGEGKRAPAIIELLARAGAMESDFDYGVERRGAGDRDEPIKSGPPTALPGEPQEPVTTITTAESPSSVKTIIAASPGGVRRFCRAW